VAARFLARIFWKRYCVRMTFAEGLLLICLFFGLYTLLRPLQQFIERWMLKFLGRNPKWVDAIIIKHEGD